MSLHRQPCVEGGNFRLGMVVGMARAFEDLSGKTFGRLLVLGRQRIGRRYGREWFCRCQCGTERWFLAGQLKRKRKGTRSCGCMSIKGVRSWLSRKREILFGQRVDLLVVTSRTRVNKFGNCELLCKCECGRERWVTTGDLNSRRIRGCHICAKAIWKAAISDARTLPDGTRRVCGRKVYIKDSGRWTTEARWLAEKQEGRKLFPSEKVFDGVVVDTEEERTCRGCGVVFYYRRRRERRYCNECSPRRRRRRSLSFDEAMRAHELRQEGVALTKIGYALGVRRSVVKRLIRGETYKEVYEQWHKQKQNGPPNGRK